MTGFPISKLKGRWRIKIPAPNAWDRNPQELCTFTNLLCESESGYCMEMTAGHVQMHNVRCFCNAGTSLSVSNTEVGLHGCILGFPKPSANYGLVVGSRGLVWLQQSVLRYCKHGAFLRDTGILKMHLCKFTRQQTRLDASFPMRQNSMSPSVGWQKSKTSGTAPRGHANFSRKLTTTKQVSRFLNYMIGQRTCCAASCYVSS